ncbi:IS3 family transposase [Sphingomonas zeae]|uniref:IS3 family transposase n=1 Tax=Sphingomonas zeae TaxID=1646122 RepID=UPI0039E7CA78
MPFHTLKVELVHQCRWVRRAEARQALFGYLEGYYNRHRRHSAMEIYPACPPKRGMIRPRRGRYPRA